MGCLANVRAHVQAGVNYQGSAPSSIRTQVLLASDPGSTDGMDFCAAAGALNPNGTCNPNIFQGKFTPPRLVDLFAGLDWQKYSLELFATNVFDERNELSRFTACGSCTRALVVSGRPRTIGLRAGVKF